MKKFLMTLSYIIKDGQVLLGYKKKGFGQGRWNGFGGKAEPGEDIKAAAAREIKEECGLTALDLSAGGILDFRFRQNPAEIFEVHVFRAAGFAGEPVESEEMRPRWFFFAEVPYGEMWDDDRYWLPRFLAGNKTVRASFLFDEKDKVAEKQVDFSYEKNLL